MKRKSIIRFIRVLMMGLLVFSGFLFNSNAQESSGTVKDIDGNVYKTVKIGNQVWMAENLKTSRYNDGTNIPLITENTAWVSMTKGAYCWYENNLANKAKYGAIYNWYTINSKLCPAGWHIPDDAQWTILTNYLGGPIIAGSKLTENDSNQKLTINNKTSSTSETGFDARLGGFRTIKGEFFYFGEYGYWWSSTEYDNLHARVRIIVKGISDVNRDFNEKVLGAYIRCVKD